jgi:hypothetical protein
MYCPNCGAESIVGLNYCKHCGGNLSEAAQPVSPPPARNALAAFILAAATVSIVLGGLGIVFSQALALIGPQPPGWVPPVHDAVAVAGMMVLFGSTTIALVTLMLIKLFARVMGFGSGADKPTRRAKTFVPAPNVAQLPAPPIPMRSVTEHTTRNFEPSVYQQDASE